MAKAKEKKPPYEKPVVVKLDEMDKASGQSICLGGSATDNCGTGSLATAGCTAGTTFSALGR
jgi:hypothetical protein